ncbi:MAG: AraC family transcriptional regulator ligand-binding domain-containing protein [Micropepsaceae bacterium]
MMISKSNGMPGRPLATPLMVRHALDLAIELGVDGDEVLSLVRLTRDAINQAGALLDCGVVTDAIETAARLSRVPDFGIRLARKLDFSSYGLIGMVAEHAKSLEQAIGELGRYVHVLNGALKLECARTADGNCISLHIEQHGRHDAVHYREALLTTGVELCRHLIAPGWNPRKVAFVHGAVSTASVYQQVFGVPVQFNQSLNMFCVSTEDFAAQSSRANTHLHSLARSQLEEFHHSLSADLMTKADAVIRSMIPLGYTAMGDLANALGMTERTLQRRLNERGVSFKQVLANARKEIVRVEALKGSVSATELVTLLGFSEPSAVSRFLREQCRDVLQGSSPGSRSRRDKSD